VHWTFCRIRRKAEKRAIVVGGSIGGSATASVLAPFFREVVVLDRDEFPKAAQTRKGVPHGHQFHTLSVGGRNTMEELFPGMAKDLIALGVPTADTAADVRYASKRGAVSTIRVVDYGTGLCRDFPPPTPTGSASSWAASTKHSTASR
jgi:hypothetical protein